MTKLETIKGLRSLRDKMQRDDIYLDDSAALTAAIEAISTANSGKLYTAFDVIRRVQEAVSAEICGLDDGGMLVAYEVERGIIGKFVKEDGCETNV